MAPPRKLPKVALVFETTNAYARELLVGIGEYILSHGPWSVHFAELGATDQPPPWLHSWDGHGVIVRGENRLIAEVVSKTGVPVIDMTPSRLLPHAPWVKSDDIAIARLAAQHFLERGFRDFAFCGDRRFSWSTRRGEQFGLLIRGVSRECHVFELSREGLSPDEEVDDIAEWLVKLPKPVAVFACYDNRGQQVLEACRRAGIAVPEEVAVLGVDNDEVLCVLSPPPLSSVTLNPRRTGWTAASLLGLMMNGERLPAEAHLIPPVGITTRQSSDVLAVADPKIASALRYIREHACEGIQVSDVLRHCPMARRALEMRFRKLLGRTPRQEILRVQLNRVKELLVGTELPVWEIAERTGFDPEYLSVVFKQSAGMAPSEYRKNFGIAR
ncbi:MAG TPA: DNA-binding transcriptional regulator [Opitutus sp.]|nr:DNA-binding transcriptional regulator [Opitutus sp.]